MANYKESSTDHHVNGVQGNSEYIQGFNDDGMNSERWEQLCMSFAVEDHVETPKYNSKTGMDALKARVFLGQKPS